MSEQTSEASKHTAGALDIRNIIGGLIGVYGVILRADGPLRRQGARQDRRRQRQPVGRAGDGRRGLRCSCSGRGSGRSWCPTTSTAGGLRPTRRALASRLRGSPGSQPGRVHARTCRRPPWPCRRRRCRSRARTGRGRWSAGSRAVAAGARVDLEPQREPAHRCTSGSRDAAPRRPAGGHVDRAARGIPLSRSARSGGPPPAIRSKASPQRFRSAASCPHEASASMLPLTSRLTVSANAGGRRPRAKATNCPGVGPGEELRLAERPRPVPAVSGPSPWRPPGPGPRRRVGAEHQPLRLAGAIRAGASRRTPVLEQPLRLGRRRVRTARAPAAGAAGRSVRRPPRRRPPASRPMATSGPVAAATARACR